MKNKCTVIHINGFGGLLIVGFIIMCAVAGFVLFPSWCCMQAWNFLAGIVANMPLMTLKHGALLWLIILLTAYATFFKKFRIAFVPRSEAMFEDGVRDNSEIIRAIKADLAENKDIVEKEEVNK